MGEHDASASKRRKVFTPDDEDEVAFAPSFQEGGSESFESLSVKQKDEEEPPVVEDKGKGKARAGKEEPVKETEKEVKDATATEETKSSTQPQDTQPEKRTWSPDAPSPPNRLPTLFNGVHVAGARPSTSMTAQQTAAHNAIHEQAVLDAADAPNQAEHGIEIDNFEDEADPFEDDGYVSDAPQSASTSVASTMYNYSFENGRRYHKFREGAYNFPNDDSEQEREDMKHAMVVNLCQVLHFAPLNNPQRILDMGTGTGIWAIEMGDQYPSATVLGVDLSPIQPNWVPPNVKFMVDDVESPWLHPENHFDYIHARHTVMAIKDWPKLLRRAYRHTKPGGWFELQEIYHVPLADSPSELSKMQPLVDFWDLVAAGLSRLGVNFRQTLSLAQLVREAGFINVTERVFHIPNGTWPKNRMLKICGLWWKTIILDGLSPIALGPLTRGLGWSMEEVEGFLVGVRSTLKEGTGATYMPLHVIYAQRPDSDAASMPERDGTWAEPVDEDDQGELSGARRDSGDVASDDGVAA